MILANLGWIYVEKSKVRQEYSWKVITAKRQQRIESYLENEIKTYNQYLQSDVYGYAITGPNSEDTLDSCWGFYGMEYCIAEAKSTVDYSIKTYRKQHSEMLKVQIINHVPLRHREPLLTM